jgi:hypothetical protein
MMRFVQKLGAGTSAIGILLISAGGMSIQRSPEGTWVEVNFIHAAGGAAILFGTLLSLVAAFAGRQANGKRPDAA